jgi:hypothetical protein
VAKAATSDTSIPTYRAKRDLVVTTEPPPAAAAEQRREASMFVVQKHAGYGLSQTRRAMIECIFGWGKQHGTMRKTKHRGITHVATDFVQSDRP